VDFFLSVLSLPVGDIRCSLVLWQGMGESRSQQEGGDAPSAVLPEGRGWGFCQMRAVPAQLYSCSLSLIRVRHSPPLVLHIRYIGLSCLMAGRERLLLPLDGECCSFLLFVKS
jgi:hypothetical protein